MNSAQRTLALTIGVLSIGACSNRKQTAEDVLAEDSTLALEVMSAKADSVSFQDDSTPAEVASTPIESTPVESNPVTSGPVTSSSVTSNSVSANAVPAQRKPQLHVQSEPLVASRRSSARSTRRVHRSVPSRQATRVSSAPVTRTPSPRVVAATPLRSSALLPAGTELALVSDQRICSSMSRVGDTFAARVATDVVGPVGVVIPKGTLALAQIASTRKNLGVDMKSIAVAGHSYTFVSDVTHTDVERVRRKSSVKKSGIAAGAGIGAVAGGVIGGNPATTVLGAAAGGLAGAVASRHPATEDQCVPEGGRIDVKLTEPLKVVISE